MRYLLLGLLFTGSFCSNRNQPSKNMQAIIFSGQETIYHFFPEDSRFISHALFKIRNNSLFDEEISIKECYFLENDAILKLDTFYLYSDDTIINNPMRIKANSEVNFRVTFRAIPVKLFLKQNYALKLIYSINHDDHETQSNITLIEER